MFTEDRTQFFNDFAIQVLWKGTVAVDAIFDNETIIVESGGVGIEMPKPVLTMPSDKILGVKQGDAFIVDSKRYLVENINDDGTGITILELSEA